MNVCSSALSKGDRWKNALEFVSWIGGHIASATRDEINIVLNSLRTIYSLTQEGELVQENSDLDVQIYAEIALSSLHRDTELSWNEFESLLCLALLINACKTQYPVYHDYMLRCCQMITTPWPSHSDNYKSQLEKTLDVYFTRVDLRQVQTGSSLTYPHSHYQHDDFV